MSRRRPVIFLLGQMTQSAGQRSVVSTRTPPGKSSLVALARITPPLYVPLPAPAIISMLVASSYNVVDAIFVGRLGTSTLAAITVSFSLVTVLVERNGRRMRRETKQ